MDHEWAASKLREFRDRIDNLSEVDGDSIEPQDYDLLMEIYGSRKGLVDHLVTLDPVMRELMEAAQPGLGDYAKPPTDGWSFEDTKYWNELVRDRVLQAIGIHALGADAREKMRPDSPDLIADQLHPWVWEAAAPLWAAGSLQEAVHAAARSVNARLQQKRGHRDKAEAALCREFFSLHPPKPGSPRLRFPGFPSSSATWLSRQQGAMDFGAGCFEGIRNPAAHEYGPAPHRANRAGAARRIQSPRSLDRRVHSPFSGADGAEGRTVRPAG